MPCGRIASSIRSRGILFIGRSGSPCASMAKKKHKSSAKLKSRRDPIPRSQRISLQKSDALSRSAQQAWARQQYERAIVLYEEALRRDPTSPELLVDLARAHGLRYRFQAAEELLERAVRLAPRNARVRCMIARSYNIIGRPEQAIEHYEQALELDPHHAETALTLTELTALYERRHRLSEAREMIERALRFVARSGRRSFQACAPRDTTG